MSTLPHDPGHASRSEVHAPVRLAAYYEQTVDEAVHEFESGAEWLGIPRPPTAELRDVCRQVAAFTAELFPRGVSIKVRNDPEITGDLYFVFEVADVGSVDEIVARHDDWHRRLVDLRGRQPGLVRLSIHAP